MDMYAGNARQDYMISGRYAVDSTNVMTYDSMVWSCQSKLTH